MARLDELGKVPEKQRQQQHLDVRAVHVRITQDADLAVAQAAQIGRVMGAVRIDANGHRDVVDFVVGKQPVALDFPGVEHLAAQGQHGLVFLVAAHFGAAAGAVALYQKDFVIGRVTALAIGELARQHGHARAFAFFDFLPGLLPRLRRLDGQLGQFFAVFDVLVQPQFECRAHKTAHQPHRIARIQPLFDLALELGVKHLGREHVAGTGKHVFGHEFHALGQQAVQLDKAFHGLEQAIAQARFVRTTGAGGNEVDVALAHRRAFFGEGHAPGGAFAFGKAVVLAVGKALALEQRDHRVGDQRLHQVVAQAAFVLPGLRIAGFFVDERDRHARHQHGFAAQQVGQLAHRERAGFKVAGIGPGAHAGALAAVALGLGAQAQGLDHIATGKHQAGDLAFAVAGHFHALRQGVGDAHAHAVQAAREAVGTAFALVKLAPRVQAGEHQLDHGGVFFGVQAKRNATAIVVDADGAIGVQRDLDLFAVPGQGFVGGVVQHFLQDVQGVVGAGVHARALFDGLQALEHADGVF